MIYGKLKLKNKNKNNLMKNLASSHSIFNFVISSKSCTFF